MKKIIALGDTHGRDYWKHVVELEPDYDVLIFMGDYFDSREGIDASVQLANFEEILEYRRDNPGREIVFLTGNHDMHYFSEAQRAGEAWSSFQSQHCREIGKALDDARTERVLRACYLVDGFLFSHAGVTKTWAKQWGIREESVVSDINALFYERPEAFWFVWGPRGDETGNDPVNSPIWVRPQSLIADQLTEYVQVVGHTPVGVIRMVPGRKLCLIDTLSRYEESPGTYFKLVDGELVETEDVRKNDKE